MLATRLASIAASSVVVPLASNCVCIAELTPSKYPISVEVTAEIATLPEPSDTTALDAVRSAVVMVETAP